MALNRWLGAVLIASVIGITGCAEPQKKQPANDPKPAETTTVAQETPDAPAASETPEAAETPEDGETPAEVAETPAAGGEVAAAGSREAIEADYENADGMAGYEEVLAMEIPAHTPEMIAKGKELFAANCTSCHGPEGKGDGDAGANLDPPPRNMTATDEYKYGHMELALFRTGAYGIEGTGMAPWGDILEPDEQWAITHYIRQELQK